MSPSTDPMRKMTFAEYKQLGGINMFSNQTAEKADTVNNGAVDNKNTANGDCVTIPGKNIKKKNFILASITALGVVFSGLFYTAKRGKIINGENSKLIANIKEGLSSIFTSAGREKYANALKNINKTAEKASSQANAENIVPKAPKDSKPASNTVLQEDTRVKDAVTEQKPVPVEDKTAQDGHLEGSNKTETRETDIQRTTKQKTETASPKAKKQQGQSKTGNVEPSDKKRRKKPAGTKPKDKTLPPEGKPKQNDAGAAQAESQPQPEGKPKKTGTDKNPQTKGAVEPETGDVSKAGGTAQAETQAGAQSAAETATSGSKTEAASELHPAPEAGKTAAKEDGVLQTGDIQQSAGESAPAADKAAPAAQNKELKLPNFVRNYTAIPLTDAKTRFTEIGDTYVFLKSSIPEYIEAFEQLKPETIAAFSDRTLHETATTLGHGINTEKLTAKLSELENNFTPEEISNICKIDSDALAGFLAGKNAINAVTVTIEELKEKAKTPNAKQIIDKLISGAAAKDLSKENAGLLEQLKPETITSLGYDAIETIFASKRWVSNEKITLSKLQEFEKAFSSAEMEAIGKTEHGVAHLKYWLNGYEDNLFEKLKAHGAAGKLPAAKIEGTTAAAQKTGQQAPAAQPDKTAKDVQNEELSAHTAQPETQALSGDEAEKALQADNKSASAVQPESGKNPVLQPDAAAQPNAQAESLTSKPTQKPGEQGEQAASQTASASDGAKTSKEVQTKSDTAQPEPAAQKETDGLSKAEKTRLEEARQKEEYADIEIKIAEFAPLSDLDARFKLTEFPENINVEGLEAIRQLKPETIAALSDAAISRIIYNGGAVKADNNIKLAQNLLQFEEKFTPDEISNICKTFNDTVGLDFWLKGWIEFPEAFKTIKDMPDLKTRVEAINAHMREFSDKKFEISKENLAVLEQLKPETVAALSNDAIEAALKYDSSLATEGNTLLEKLLKLEEKFTPNELTNLCKTEEGISVLSKWISYGNASSLDTLKSKVGIFEQLKPTAPKAEPVKIAPLPLGLPAPSSEPPLQQKTPDILELLKSSQRKNLNPFNPILKADVMKTLKSRAEETIGGIAAKAQGALEEGAAKASSAENIPLNARVENLKERYQKLTGKVIDSDSKNIEALSQLKPETVDAFTDGVIIKVLNSANQASTEGETLASRLLKLEEGLTADEIKNLCRTKSGIETLDNWVNNRLAQQGFSELKTKSTDEYVGKIKAEAKARLQAQKAAPGAPETKAAAQAEAGDGIKPIGDMETKSNPLQSKKFERVELTKALMDSASKAGITPLADIDARYEKVANTNPDVTDVIPEIIKVFKQTKPETITAMNDYALYQIAWYQKNTGINPNGLMKKLAELENNFTPEEISNICKTNSHKLGKWLSDEERWGITFEDIKEIAKTQNAQKIIDGLKSELPDGFKEVGLLEQMKPETVVALGHDALNDIVVHTKFQGGGKISLSKIEELEQNFSPAQIETIAKTEEGVRDLKHWLTEYSEASFETLKTHCIADKLPTGLNRRIETLLASSRNPRLHMQDSNVEALRQLNSKTAAALDDKTVLNLATSEICLANDRETMASRLLKLEEEVSADKISELCKTQEGQDMIYNWTTLGTKEDFDAIKSYGSAKAEPVPASEPVPETAEKKIKGLGKITFMHKQRARIERLRTYVRDTVYQDMPFVDNADMIEALKNLKPETLRALSDTDIERFIRIGGTYNLKQANIMENLLKLEEEFIPQEISNLCATKAGRDNLAGWFTGSDNIEILKLHSSDDFVKAFDLVNKLAEQTAETAAGDLTDSALRRELCNNFNYAIISHPKFNEHIFGTSPYHMLDDAIQEVLRKISLT